MSQLGLFADPGNTITDLDDLAGLHEGVTVRFATCIEARIHFRKDRWTWIERLDGTRIDIDLTDPTHYPATVTDWGPE